MAMPGGLSKPTCPSAEMKQRLTPTVAAYLKYQLGVEPKHVKIVALSSQIVNGTVYFLKVQHDKGVCHMRVHEELPANGGNLVVENYKEATCSEPLTFF
ncbi:unnamed protein product [Mesocestoides corti]|uniref:Cystatin domain-containing protein n=2 Tax=Mesocestoides corti TaxID=53468 RepID=A0A0R3UCJ4_MESCO|nr:unnamed protein product [Mesocestoides corti]